MIEQPLVDEGEPLDAQELARYSRQLRMPEIGISGQRRLKRARVLIIGAGGLGSPAILYLAAAGVGTIGVVDDDTVSIANLHRQILHDTYGLGDTKLASAVRAVHVLNPHVRVIEHAIRIDAASARELVPQYDVVLDGSDNFDTRYAIADAAADAGVPLVWGSVLRGDGQVSVFWNRDDEDSRTLRDLFPFGADDGQSCETAGVIGPLCGTVGSLMATETIKLIAGFGRVLRARVLVVDAIDAGYTEIPFGPRAPTNDHTPSNTGGPVTEKTPSISAAELVELLREREEGATEFVLVDIREPFEREIVAIDGSVFIPMQGLLQENSRAEMPQDAMVILHCHHDSRSSYARDVLEQQGWQNVLFLEGGIHAWVTQIEPDKATY